MAWDLPDDIVDAADRTAEHFNKFKGCFNVLSQHIHSGLDGQGGVLSGIRGMMDGYAHVFFYSAQFSATVNSTGGLLGRVSTSFSGGGIKNFIFFRPGVYQWVIHHEAPANTMIRAYLDDVLISTIRSSTENPVTLEIEIAAGGVHGIGFAFNGTTPYLNAFGFLRTGDIDIAPPALTWKTKTFVEGEVLTATDLNQIRDNFRILENHTHTGRPGDGSEVIGDGSDDAYLPQVQVLARFPKSSTGFSYTTSGNYRLGFVAQSSAQNDEIVFPVGLQAGTYRLEFLYGKGSNCGIATFWLDAGSLGTIDTYNAATSYNDASAITGITVAADGWYDLKIKMATKHASSSGYVCRWQAVNLVRTGA